MTRTFDVVENNEIVNRFKRVVVFVIDSSLLLLKTVFLGSKYRDNCEGEMKRMTDNREPDYAEQSLRAKKLAARAQIAGCRLRTRLNNIE